MKHLHQIIKKRIFIMIIVLIHMNSYSQSIGEPATDFTLVTLSGGTFTLSDNIGKVVVIYIFGYSCPICLSTGENIDTDLYQVYADRENFITIGVDIWNGDNGAVQSFKSVTNITFPILVKGSSLQNTYIPVQDRLMVVDKEGILRHRGTTAAYSDINNVKSIVDTYLEPTSVENHKFEEKNKLNIHPGFVSNSAVISFQLNSNSKIQLSVYNISGKQIMLLNEGFYETGKYQVEFNSNDIPGGIYFIKMKSDKEEVYKKFVVR